MESSFFNGITPPDIPHRFVECPPGNGVYQGAALVFALPYGNDFEEPQGGAIECCAMEGGAMEGGAVIAPFARHNYYKELVRRLKKTAAELRKRYNGEKSDYRIFCNSKHIDEKMTAAQSGLGFYGRNGLIIVPPYGSLVVLAVLTLGALPGGLFARGAYKEKKKNEFPLCSGCDPENPPCKKACPTGSLDGKGGLLLERCIQWYASGNGAAIPEDVKANWGRTLYGCTKCQDACPHNQKKITGIRTELGKLPAAINAEKLIHSSDEEIKALFKGSALGLSWLNPETIRRSASLAAQQQR